VSYRRQDPFYKRAKATGYRARSAFKLSELDQRYHLLARGDHVLDVGAWPGGWMQVALERVGPTGLVVGVDLARIEPLGAPNALTLELDVRDPDAPPQLQAALGRAADVVLSDLSPKLTGVRARDEAAASELTEALLSMLGTTLRVGGRLVMKMFMSPDFRERAEQIGAQFATTHRTRAEATRRGSSELYLVALGFRGSPERP